MGRGAGVEEGKREGGWKVRSKEEIEAVREKLAKLACLIPVDPRRKIEFGHAYASVVYKAREYAHILTWVLNLDPATTNPFHILGQCCCDSNSWDAEGRLVCGFGPGMCLSPSNERQVPEETLESLLKRLENLSVKEKAGKLREEKSET